MEIPQIDSDSTGDFSVTRHDGRRYTKMTITFGTICLLVGILTRGAMDVSDIYHEQAELLNRVTNLESENKVQSAEIENDKQLLASNIDRSVDQKARLAATETSLNQTRDFVQKLSETNARLEERVIFLVAQVEGRMSGPAQNSGGRLK